MVTNKLVARKYDQVVRKMIRQNAEAITFWFHSDHPEDGDEKGRSNVYYHYEGGFVLGYTLPGELHAPMLDYLKSRAKKQAAEAMKRREEMEDQVKNHMRGILQEFTKQATGVDKLSESEIENIEDEMDEEWTNQRKLLAKENLITYGGKKTFRIFRISLTKDKRSGREIVSMGDVTDAFIELARMAKQARFDPFSF